MRAKNFKEVVVALVGPTLQNLFFENYSKSFGEFLQTKCQLSGHQKEFKLEKTFFILV